MILVTVSGNRRTGARKTARSTGREDSSNSNKVLQTRHVSSNTNVGGFAEANESIFSLIVEQIRAEPLQV